MPSAGRVPGRDGQTPESTMPRGEEPDGTGMAARRTARHVGRLLTPRRPEFAVAEDMARGRNTAKYAISQPFQIVQDSTHHP